MAYEGPEIPLAVPDITIREESEGEGQEDELPKRGSFIRRSLSFRKVRRTRSASPAVNLPGKSPFSGMELHTIESDRIKTQSTTAKYAMLPQHYLEKLELGSSHFEACLSVDSSQKGSTTFIVPLSTRGRSVSPFPEFTSKREMLPPSKLATKGLRQRSMTDTQETSLLLVPKSEKALRRSFSSAATTPPIDPASGQTAISPHPLSSSPRPLTQSPEGQNLHRPKPKRPAPSRPPLAENRKSSGSIIYSPSISPIPTPPQNSRSGSSSPIIPTHDIPPKNETQVDVEVHEGSVPTGGNPFAIPIPPIPPPLHGISAVQVRAPKQPETAATKVNEATINHPPSSSSSQPPPKFRPMVRKASLYISPHKNMHTRQKTLDKIVIEPVVDDTEKRTSKILKAGGVSDGTLDSSRDDLLVAIRTGIRLKKVEKEETERAKRDTMMAWDVAAILERRRAIELDSDSGSEQGYGITEEEWEDS